MLNVFDIAHPEDRSGDRLLAELPEGAPELPNQYTWFAVQPAELYPATLAHIQKVLEGQRPPDPLGMYFDAARRLAPAAWAAAELERAACPVDLLAVRAEALEIARLWFTEMLHQAAAGPIGLHILKDERYRL